MDEEGKLPSIIANGRFRKYLAFEREEVRKSKYI